MHRAHVKLMDNFRKGKRPPSAKVVQAVLIGCFTSSLSPTPTKIARWMSLCCECTARRTQDIDLPVQVRPKDIEDSRVEDWRGAP